MLKTSADLVRWLSAGLLGLLTLIAAFELFAWLLFSRSFATLEELQGLLMIWLGLLAAAYCLTEGLHLALDLVVRRLPTGWQPTLGRLPGAFVALFGCLMLIYGIRLVRVTHNTLPATGWSASLQYQPAVVAGGLFLVFGLAFWRSVTSELNDRSSIRSPRESARKSRN